MRHASLFSGIGGFDLAAQWMGWENVFHCEKDPFCKQVLSYHFPESKSYDDIKQTTFTIYSGGIDVLTGGFPCQPFSSAGRRRGTEDDRYLWDEMLRAIKEIQPRWVVGENVRGLLNWNGGMVLDTVETDLENEGYEVSTFLLPAASVNAPHRRDRVFIVGRKIDPNSGSNGVQQSAETQEVNDQGIREGMAKGHEPDPLYGDRATADSKHKGREYREEESVRAAEEGVQYDWQNFPTVSPILSGDDGISARLDIDTVYEGCQRKRKNPFPRWRNESIKGAGNAVVPQLVMQVFKAIEQYENS